MFFLIERHRTMMRITITTAPHPAPTLTAMAMVSTRLSNSLVVVSEVVLLGITTIFAVV